MSAKRQQLSPYQMVDLALPNSPNFTVLNLQMLHSLLHVLVKKANIDNYLVEFDETIEPNEDVMWSLVQQEPSVKISEFKMVYPDNEQGKRELIEDSAENVKSRLLSISASKVAVEKGEPESRPHKEINSNESLVDVESISEAHNDLQKITKGGWNSKGSRAHLNHGNFEDLEAKVEDLNQRIVAIEKTNKNVELMVNAMYADLKTSEQSSRDDVEILTGEERLIDVVHLSGGNSEDVIEHFQNKTPNDISLVISKDNQGNTAEIQKKHMSKAHTSSLLISHQSLNKPMQSQMENIPKSKIYTQTTGHFVDPSAHSKENIPKNTNQEFPTIGANIPTSSHKVTAKRSQEQGQHGLETDTDHQIRFKMLEDQIELLQSHLGLRLAAGTNKMLRNVKCISCLAYCNQKCTETTNDVMIKRGPSPKIKKRGDDDQHFDIRSCGGRHTVTAPEERLFNKQWTHNIDSYVNSGQSSFRYNEVRLKMM